MLNRRSFVASAGVALAVPAVHSQSKPVKIGLMLPLSGIGADLGTQWLKAAQLAAKHWNAQGGLLGRQIEFVVRDDKYSSAGAVAAGRELAGAGINLMIGAGQSPMGLGLAPVLPEIKSVCVAIAASAMSLTHENYQRNLFRLSPNAYMIYVALAKAVVPRYPDVTKWASLAFDSEYGRDLSAFFEYGARKAAGGRTLSFREPIFVPPTKTDYKVEINALMSSGAEGLCLGLIGAGAISFLQQARSVGLTKKLKVIAEGGNDLLIGRAMQKSTPSNIWSFSFWHPQIAPFKGNPVSDALYQQLLAEGERYPVGILTMCHRSCQALFTGIKRANSLDTEAVITAMEGMTFDTSGGSYTVRKEDHQGYGKSYFAKIGSRDAEPFYGVDDLEVVDEAQVIDPASPGKKFVAA